jgi:hypothetical protein
MDMAKHKSTSPCPYVQAYIQRRCNLACKHASPIIKLVITDMKHMAAHREIPFHKRQLHLF